ncbi:GNAT family N-acetyltransferase [Candidatus Riflebacteria bacterium]
MAWNFFIPVWKKMLEELKAENIAVLLDKLAITNRAATALDYYYFVEKPEREKRIFQFVSPAGMAIACMLPEVKFCLIRGSHASAIISLINTLMQKFELYKYYFNTNLPSSAAPGELAFPQKNIEVNKVYSLKADALCIQAKVDGFQLEKGYKKGRYFAFALKEGKLASSCTTNWVSSAFAEIGGATKEQFRKKGLFGWLTSTISKLLLAKNITPLYMFEKGNVGSQRVAERLGFRDTEGRELCFYVSRKKELNLK